MTPEETSQHFMTTSEMLKYSIPALIAIIAAMIRTYYVAHQNAKDLETQDKKTSKTLEKYASDLDTFRFVTYAAERKELSQEIRDARKSTEESERRLETKLDRLDSRTDLSLSKIHDKIDETKTLLAEIRGSLKLESKRTT